MKKILVSILLILSSLSVAQVIECDNGAMTLKEVGGVGLNYKLTIHDDIVVDYILGDLGIYDDGYNGVYALEYKSDFNNIVIKLAKLTLSDGTIKYNSGGQKGNYSAEIQENGILLTMVSHLSSDTAEYFFTNCKEVEKSIWE